jgi:hypothetical protein
MVNPFFGIFIGTNGTGKTTQILKLCYAAKKTILIPANLYDEKYKSFDYLSPEDLKNDFTDIKLYYNYNYKIDQLLPKIKNTLFVIDDFKNYIPNNGALNKIWQNFFSSRRHMNNDIILSTHSIHRVNPFLFDFNPTLILFKTTRPINKSLKEKIINFEDLEKAQKRINVNSVKNRYYFESFDIG